MNNNMLESIIKNEISDGFKNKVKFTEDNWTEWETVLENATYIPVEYTPSSLVYQNEYIRCFYEQIIDLSMIIYQNDVPICVWPLTLSFHDGRYVISTNEKEVLPPFFMKGISDKTKKAVFYSAKMGIERISDLLPTETRFDSWMTRCNMLDRLEDNSTRQWFRKCMEDGGEADIITDLYVNLELPLNHIHSMIRKSYRSLINRAKTLWNAEIFDQVSVLQFEEFHNKHVEIAGRQTRSQKTWDLQRESVNNGKGFLVRLSNEDGEYVGEGLFQYSRDEGIYAVGVYDRSLFNEPVSHLVQWTAIQHMKELGLKHYKIGQRYWNGKTMNLIRPTEKELSISYFKEGFATDFADTVVIKNPVGGGQTNG